MPDRARLTQLLMDADGPDPPDLDTALAELYDELRRIAGAYLKRERPDHTLQPTALVHEAYGRLVDQTQIPWADAAHFRAIAARVMRQVLVDHARKHRALKRGGDGGGGSGEQRARVTLSAIEGAASTEGVDVLELDELLDRLRGLNERKARVVELLFFGGLTHREAAAVIGVSQKTVESDWYMARAWLGKELRGADA